MSDRFRLDLGSEIPQPSGEELLLAALAAGFGCPLMIVRKIAAALLTALPACLRSFFAIIREIAAAVLATFMASFRGLFTVVREVTRVGILILCHVHLRIWRNIDGAIASRGSPRYP